MGRFWFAIPAGLALVAVFAFGQDDKVARGKYLVEEVAKCQDCHSPRMENGNFIKSSWMKGATLNMTPAIPTQGWHAAAPDITPNGAIWKRWNEEGMVAFLETGKTPRGGAAGAPMPTYTLKHDDAVAVVAFLKSLQ